MRTYMGGGRRGPWVGGEPDGRLPFQRADGTVMTNEEIARVATTEQVKASKLDAPRTGPRSGRRLSDADLAEANRLFEEIGAREAARILGVSYWTVKDRVKAYRKSRDGAAETPLPASDQQVGEQHADEPGILDIAATTLTEALRPHSETPVIAVVHHGDPDARAAAFLEGYDKAIEDHTPPKAIDALIDWLTENAQDWTDAEAERWLKAFTATIDLVYPTRAAA